MECLWTVQSQAVIVVTMNRELRKFLKIFLIHDIPNQIFTQKKYKYTSLLNFK